jgi:hypothetical protein
MKKLFTVIFLFGTTINVIAQSGTSKFKFVKLNSIPKPTAPAKLVVSEVTFFDDAGNKNKMLDAEEKAELKFTIENTGSGDAYAIEAIIEDNKKVKGLEITKNYSIGDLPSGKKINVTIPITGLTELESSNPDLGIKIIEGNKFDVEDKISLSFKTLELRKPKFTINEHIFANKDKEGKITKGNVIQLSILLQNSGEGDAKNITIDFGNPDNVFPSGKTNFEIPILKAKEVKKIDYEFFANTQYNEANIPISIKVSESMQKYFLNETKSISLQSTLAKVQRVDVIGKEEDKITYANISLTSDVDRNIPESKIKYENKYALIIGNEDYMSYQSNLAKEQNVEFAISDARSFKEYCEKTFGIPEENITYITNGTLGQMKQGIALLNAIIKKSAGDLEIFFYYAGHGAPDEITKESYLIPVDVSGSKIQDGIKLTDVYSALTQYESNKVTMFVDACFSGGARNQELTATRGIKIIPRSDLLKGNIVSFSASSGTQSSYAYSSKNHGIFTYFLLKTIQEANGDISYKDMWEKVKSKVSIESLKVNKVEQDPQENIGINVENIWQQWKFK